jgi:hypothetical protein
MRTHPSQIFQQHCLIDSYPPHPANQHSDLFQSETQRIMLPSAPAPQ